jgi:hypothetical protein
LEIEQKVLQEKRTTGRKGKRGKMTGDNKKRGNKGKRRDNICM